MPRSFTDEAVTIRPAARDDVPAIVALLANDPLGAQREHDTDPLPQAYYEAFDSINGDDSHELVVMETKSEVIGTLQLSILPYLTYQGGARGLIEAVRVKAGERGIGLGARLIQWAVDRAREHHCHMVQLTTDKARPDAAAFYEKLGFKASHEGLKLHL
jgi:GNAT superfamily N-acetyltransferase